MTARFESHPDLNGQNNPIEIALGNGTPLDCASAFVPLQSVLADSPI